MLKTVFINIFKISLAAGLIFWLVNSGKLDFKLLASLSAYPLEVACAVILAVFNVFFVSYRWRSVLEARGQTHLPILGLVKITWIGQFFSTVLPGSVSGDLVKILYIQKYDQSFSKKFIFVSILIDRVMGLSGLILLIGGTSLIFSGHILENAPSMKPLIDINHVLVGLVLLSFFIFIFLDRYVRLMFVWAESKFLPSLWAKIIQLWDDLVLIKSKLLKALLVSFVLQFNAVVVFWCLIHPFVGNHMDFVQALAFIPLGLMTLALPVAPSGLGVGHAIFQKLFEFSGINNGASLFNLYFFLNLMVNIIGVIPYLLAKQTKD